jgi:hypothetical protein
MDRKSESAFDGEKNLLAGRTCVERGAYLTTRPCIVQGRAGAMQREGNQLNFL